MAEVSCAICQKETERSYKGVKYCPKWGPWFFCSHAGPGAIQCPKCECYSFE